MITKDEIQELLHSTETYRVERTTSTDERSKGRGQTRLDYALQGGRRREPTGDMDKFQEAICAFANDNGGKVGGKVGGNVVENIVENIIDVPSLSPALSQVLSQGCHKLDVSHYPDATAILIALCKGLKSLKELMEQTKEKNRGRIKENVLQHLCESSLVEPTIKDVPNSPKQKYTLTDEGREKLQAILVIKLRMKS